MNINQLLERRLIFIAGKGGVGKSTIAAALALTAARRGKSVCIVESDAQEQMARIFSTDAVGYEGNTLAPNVRGISVTTSGALREYAQTRLPFRQISRHFIDNRLTRYFLDATPGLKELLTLGKIIDLVQKNLNEMIIVDLPATGHGLAMLGVPDVVKQAVHAGPLRRHAEEINEVLNDPSLSAVCFVALAEELSTTETVELHKKIEKKLDIAIGPVIANCVHKPPFDEKHESAYESLKRRWLKNEDTALLIEGAELSIARAELNQRYLDRLTKDFKNAPVVVPFYFVEAIDRDALALISDELDAGGSR
jgi:anion-transporting  ArsA/GET3 family ATPase